MDYDLALDFGQRIMAREKKAGRCAQRGEVWSRQLGVGGVGPFQVWRHRLKLARTRDQLSPL